MTAAPDLVDHVHAVVLAVGARDAQEEREPAPEAEAPLVGEPAAEDELVALAPEVLAGLLRDAVDEDLELLADSRRELHARLVHGVHRMPAPVRRPFERNQDRALDGRPGKAA